MERLKRRKKGRVQVEKQEKNQITAWSVMIVLTVVCIIFSTLCLYNTAIAFLYENATLFSIIIGVLLILACAIVIWFYNKDKQVLYKTGLSAFIFLLFCLVLIYIFQKTGFFNIVKDENSLQEYLSGKGAWMPFVYVLLQYLQVVILPIPSVVSTLAGVALFGPFQTILYSLIGILLGSLTAFFIGRKLGNKAVIWMIGEETLLKWQKKLKGKDNLLLTMMFLLPVFPDDVLCFIAGLSSMSTKYFVIMITCSRILSISTTCYSIKLLPLNTWWGLLAWAIIILTVVIVFILIYKNLDKIQEHFNERKKKKNDINK